MDVGQLARANRLARTGEARAIRERSGVSLRTLAEALGTNPGELSRWERGLARPRPSSALRWLGEIENLRAELLRETATPPAIADGATSDLLTQAASSIAPGDPQRGTARDAG